ncbi:MAG: hypothetical protein WCE21_03725 [Candidatus Babeliales bacterium]
MNRLKILLLLISLSTTMMLTADDSSISSYSYKVKIFNHTDIAIKAQLRVPNAAINWGPLYVGNGEYQNPVILQTVDSIAPGATVVIAETGHAFCRTCDFHAELFINQLTGSNWQSIANSIGTRRNGTISDMEAEQVHIYSADAQKGTGNPTFTRFNIYNWQVKVTNRTDTPIRVLLTVQNDTGKKLMINNQHSASFVIQEINPLAPNETKLISGSGFADCSNCSYNAALQVGVQSFDPQEKLQTIKSDIVPTINTVKSDDQISQLFINAVATIHPGTATNPTQQKTYAFRAE